MIIMIIMIIDHHRHDLVQYAVVGWKPDPDSAARMRSVPRQAMVKHASLDHSSSPSSPHHHFLFLYLHLYLCFYLYLNLYLYHFTWKHASLDHSSSPPSRHHHFANCIRRWGRNNISSYFKLNKKLYLTQREVWSSKKMNRTWETRCGNRGQKNVASLEILKRKGKGGWTHAN